MLEANDMRCIIEVAPFIGALIDRMCGEDETAPCTTILTTLTKLYLKVNGQEKVLDTSRSKLGQTERDLID